MNTVYQYMKSQGVIDVYMKNLGLIKDETEYQHFLARLSVVNKSHGAIDAFKFKLKELEELLRMDPNQAFELALEEDSHGYLNDLKKKNDPDIKKYLWICRITDAYNILRRNDQIIPKDTKQKVYDLLDEETIAFMCRTSKNSYLRKHEGTLCVNGIGYLLYLWGDTIRTDVKEAFIDLFRYYINKVWEYELTNRNFVYGLTHCVIDISDFYTKNVNDQIRLFQKTFPIGELYDQTISAICNCLKEIVEGSDCVPSLNSLSSDMLAELLVTYKLLTNDYPSNKWYAEGYAIGRAYDVLCNRIDPKYGYIRDHKEEDRALDLKRNEHTNILFILYSRL